MKKSNFTAEEKTKIVVEGLNSKTSVAALSRKYGISRTTYNNWRKKFLEGGKQGLCEMPVEEDYSDRRKYKRVKVSVPVSISRLSALQKKAIIKLLTSDISSGGAYFDTGKTLPDGEKVKLEIFLPVKKIDIKHATHVLVKVNGVVCRSCGAGMAVIFDDNYEIYRLHR